MLFDQALCRFIRRSTAHTKFVINRMIPLWDAHVKTVDAVRKHL